MRRLSVEDSRRESDAGRIVVGVGRIVIRTERPSRRGARVRRMHSHPRHRGVRMRLLRYVAIWTLLVILFPLQWYATDAVRGFTWLPWDYLRWSMVEWYTLALPAPGVFWITSRFPVEPPHR